MYNVHVPVHVCTVRGSTRCMYMWVYTCMVFLLPDIVAIKYHGFWCGYYSRGESTALDSLIGRSVMQDYQELPSQTLREEGKGEFG